MKWKEVLLGAFASLVVTIIAGIALYYFTKEPDQKKSEQLLYTVQQSASFKGGTQDVALAVVTLENDGGVAAKHVLLVATFKYAQIKDFALESSAGSKKVVSDVNPRNIQLAYETLLPTEMITLNLLLSSAEAPSVSVRSDSTLGVEKLPKPQTPSLAPIINEFLKIAVPLTGVLVTLLAILGFVILRRGGIAGQLDASTNNAGFLLLHHGFLDEATSLLNSSLQSGRYDPFTLSNLAVCKALKGEREQAKQLLRAANFRKQRGHAKAVILFNEALVALTDGKKDEAFAKLSDAIATAPTEIRRYCQQSIHFDSVRDDPGFRDLMKDT